MLKKHFYVIRRLSCGQKFTIQQYGARCHTANFVSNSLNENIPNYIRKENDLLILVTSIYLIMQFCDMMKKMLYKNAKQYEDIQGLSAAISDAWDRLTKKIINNSIGQWRMPLENVVEEGGGRIEHLV